MTSLATRRSTISWAFFFTGVSLGPVSAEGRPEGVEGGTSLELRPCASSRRFCTPEEETPEVVLESSALEKVISGDRDPERPRLGACPYFPHISLRLPAVLPDIALDDLRTFALPSPIPSLGWIARRERVEWLEATRNGGFEPWEVAGPRLAEVDRRFPDL